MTNLEEVGEVEVCGECGGKGFARQRVDDRQDERSRNTEMILRDGLARLNDKLDRMLERFPSRTSP